MAWELNRLLPAQPAAQESRDEGGHTQCKGEQAICIKNLRPPATRWLMQPRLVFCQGGSARRPAKRFGSRRHNGTLQVTHRELKARQPGRGD